MITRMPPRRMPLGFAGAIALVFATLACGGPQASGPGEPGEPTTAVEKQRREARASGEIDPVAGKWGGWRYQGDRDDCFYVIGRRCFKTHDAACRAAKCDGPKTCTVEGGGPATVSCK